MCIPHSARPCLADESDDGGSRRRLRQSAGAESSAAEGAADSIISSGDISETILQQGERWLQVMLKGSIDPDAGNSAAGITLLSTAYIASRARRTSTACQVPDSAASCVLAAVPVPAPALGPGVQINPALAPEIEDDSTSD